MSQTPMDSSSVERRVEEIVAAFYAEADQGRRVDWRDLLTQHPDLAPEIERFFAGADKWQRFVDPLRDDPTPVGPSDATPTLARTDGRSEQAVPASFGDYELLEEIARGGMGVVYKARQRSLNRVVAVKMILGGPTASPDDLQRFRLEAEAAAQLDHPHIVPIHEVGECNGFHFFSMKLIDGGSLAQWLTVQRPLPERERAGTRLLAQVARAVQYAHERGILHRDLKPGNILLSGQWPVVSGQPGSHSAASPLTTDHWPLTTGNAVPYVTDFGLAKRLEVESHLTQTGAIVGTPSYMSPEQAMGNRKLDITTDVYSLGAILYQIVTGRRPFEAETPLATIARIHGCEVETPRSIDRNVDRGLEAIVLKCLEKRPKDRYSSALALAEDLERWERGDVLSVNASWWQRARRWLGRRRRVLVGAYLVCLAAILGVVGWNYRQDLLEREKILQREREQFNRIKLEKDREKLEQIKKHQDLIDKERKGS